MSRQSKRVPLTVLTVSDVPSRQTEPFGAIEPRQAPRRLEPEARRLAEVVALHDRRDPVDMAAHHVSRQLVAELERPFEIDAPADVPLRGGGDVERLRRRVDLEHGLAALGAVARHHGHADAVAGDRAADRQLAPA